MQDVFQELYNVILDRRETRRRAPIPAIFLKRARIKF